MVQRVGCSEVSSLLKRAKIETRPDVQARVTFHSKPTRPYISLPHTSCLF